MDKKYKNLDRHDVISLPEPIVLLIPDEDGTKNKTPLLLITCKVNQFIYALESQSDFIGEKWVDEGVECEVLSPGKDWRKGKVRVSLEFIPDEPEIKEQDKSDEPTNNESESILDDLRRRIQQSN